MAVPIEQLVPDPHQPRRDMGADRLTELSDSLKEYGMLQPLLVREDGYLDDGRTRYMIVAGGRRYAAAQQAGLTRLPVVVRDTEGATLRMTQLVENIQRQDLAPLEEARAFQELMDAEGLTAAALATRLHISPQTVRDRLLLLSDQAMADAVQRGQIGTAVARDILRAADEPRTVLRGLVEAGETVTKATVKDVRDRATAAGVTNPRKTGGGRRATDQTAAAGTLEHNRYAPSAPSGEQTPSAPDVVQGLYEAFKGWETQVSQLTPHDLQRLVGLIRGDMQNLIASITEMTSHAQEQMH